MAQRRRFHRRRQGASGQAASGGCVPSGTPVSTPGPPEPSDSMGGNSEQDRMSWEQYQQQQQHRQPQRGRGGAAAATAAGAAGAGGAGRAGAGGDALGGRGGGDGGGGEEELEGTYVWGNGGERAGRGRASSRRSCSTLERQTMLSTPSTRSSWTS
ncbi:hypothetical protein CLOP_g11728 [Closterium sp. NIES-67]|nr:hypothetical protein CLOP_g11728 [Closterium sp. NIES-67]